MNRRPPTPRLLLLTGLAGLILLLRPARALRSDNFVFYLPNARHAVPLEIIHGKEYLPLLQVLNQVERVNGMQVSQSSCRVWSASAEIETRADDKKVRVNKSTIKLAEPVRVEKGQWMVPLDFLVSVLPQLTRMPVSYRAGAHRLYLGDVKPATFTARLVAAPQGAHLSIHFTERITVRTAAANGKWLVFLGDQPVEPLEPALKFDSPYLRELQYDDADGNPKLILTPGPQGLNFYPVVAENGQALEADVLSAPRTEQAQAPAPPPSNPPAGGQPAGTAGANPSPGAPQAPAEAQPAFPPGTVVVVLDAGHGGDDPGAHDRNGLLEKDLVADLVARVRSTLVAGGKYGIVLTRLADMNVSFDQRDIAANAAGAKVFLSFHAGNLGRRVPAIAVYSDHFAPAQAAGAGPSDLFVPWLTAQQTHLAESHRLVEALKQQLGALPGVVLPSVEEAPVRVLRSVNAPAAAIELGSFAPDVDASPLAAPDFEQQVASAVARALDAYQGGNPQP